MHLPPVLSSDYHLHIHWNIRPSDLLCNLRYADCHHYRSDHHGLLILPMSYYLQNHFHFRSSGLLYEFLLRTAYNLLHNLLLFLHISELSHTIFQNCMSAVHYCNRSLHPSILPRNARYFRISDCSGFL